MEKDHTIPLLAAVVLLAAIVSYGIALNGPLFFDDVPNLLANTLVQIDGGNFDGWRVAALSSGSGSLFRPVAMLSFALNHAVAGTFTPFSLKATNLLVHLLIAVLVYQFAQALLRAPALHAHRLEADERRLVALVAAAIWLLHPIHVSTVLYAVQRMAQLSALFTLIGLLVFTRYRLRWAEFGATTGELIAASLWLFLCGVLAVLSKENGALLPWLAIVVEIMLFRGVWHGQRRGRLVGLGWFLFILPPLVLTIVVFVSPDILTGRFGGREFTLHERLLTQARALWHYVSWLIVPNIVDMGFFHDDIPLSRSLWSPWTTALSLFAWAALFGAALLGHRRYPFVAFAVLFFLVAHSMESSVLALELVFEHRNYLPSVGLAVLAGVLMVRCTARFNKLQRRAIGAIALSLLIVLLALRTQAWRDEMTLARFEVTNHPQSARAHFFYANVLFKRLEQARALHLDEEEKRALAIASRRYFERMHQLNDREFAALVMLYQIDTLYFPGLVEKNDWLGQMEKLAGTRRLQSSDRTALGALVEFSLTPPGVSGRTRVAGLVEQLIGRYPSSPFVLGFKFRLASADDGYKSADLLAALEHVSRSNPESRQAAAYLAQFHSNEDLSGTYEAMREWLRRDKYRRELPVIREIFEH